MTSAPLTTNRELIVERLWARSPTTPRDRIRTVVDEVAHELADARITQYLPILIEKVARDQLNRQETIP